MGFWERGVQAWSSVAVVFFDDRLVKHPLKPALLHDGMNDTRSALSTCMCRSVSPIPKPYSPNPKSSSMSLQLRGPPLGYVSPGKYREPVKPAAKEE